MALNALLTNTRRIANFAHYANAVEADMVVVRTREERLQIMLSPEELSVVDDFRFKKRMPSRAAAVRELLKRGLSAEGFVVAANGVKSSEFGVTGKTSSGRS